MPLRIPDFKFDSGVKAIGEMGKLDHQQARFDGNVDRLDVEAPLSVKRTMEERYLLQVELSEHVAGTARGGTGVGPFLLL